MSKISIADAIEQDIQDLKGIFDYEQYGLTKTEAKLQARGIMANLQDHLEELIIEN